MHFLSAEGVVSGVSVIEGIVSSAASDMQGMVATIAPAALGVGLTVLAITFGWKLFRRFTKG